MLSLSYANPGTGPLSGGIGWIDWGTLVVGIGQSFTNQTARLRDGSTLKFDIANTLVTGTGLTVSGVKPPTFSRAPFGTVGYLGIQGNVVLYTTLPFNGSGKITISNISVTDPFGKPVPEYIMYYADGEATSNPPGEIQSATTNGDNWGLLTTIGGGVSPSLSGLGSQTVTLTGTSTASFNAPVVSTRNPTQISTLLKGGVVGTDSLEGAVIGITINKISLNKVIVNRFDSSDQFSLSVTGANNATTTTFGSTFGTQPVSAYIFPNSLALGTYTLNESMSPGSASTLNQYNQTISYTNLTPGGTAVPSANTLPGSVNITTSDIIIATITNSVIPPTLSTVKQGASFALANSTFTYTITFRNNGTVTSNNVLFIDTIPNGASFISNSAVLNGTPISGSPEPPTGLNIGNISPGGLSTLSFTVKVSTTLPSPNPLINNSTTTFNYNLLPSTGFGGTTSNSVSTLVGLLDISISKGVNKSIANVNDILTYSVVLKNTGNITITSMTFVDTLPTGVNFVNNSLAINGATQIGFTPNFSFPSPPLPLPQNSVITVTFNALVASIPSPNPISNFVTSSYSGTFNNATITNSKISNNAITQINNASLSGITKYTNKSFIDCGEIITYTIAIPNSGNVTAQNIIFKDTIPNGTTFVTNSVFIDGTQQFGATPSTGVIIPNIAPGSTRTLTFNVKVNCT